MTKSVENRLATGTGDRATAPLTQWGVRLAAGLTCLALSLHGGIAAAADGSAADFYRGKRLTVVIGTGTGGDYDLHGRLLARYYNQHVPGRPTLVVQNIPGAGSITAANHIFYIAPQDGTVLGNILNTVPLGLVLGIVNAQFDPAKLQWIGNMRHEVSTILASERSGVRSIDDAKVTSIQMGSTAPSALNSIIPNMVNQAIGTKFKVITGYKETASIVLALEQGEVSGIAGLTWYGPNDHFFQAVQTGQVHILAQIGLHPALDLPQVPLLREFARNDDERKLLDLFSSPAVVGKPTVVGPGVPADRVKVLRDAYMETMADPAFLRDAEKLGVPISPIGGEDLNAVVLKILATPPDLAQRARAAVAK